MWTAVRCLKCSRDARYQTLLWCQVLEVKRLKVAYTLEDFAQGWVQTPNNFPQDYSRHTPQVPLYCFKICSSSARASCCCCCLCKTVWNLTLGPYFKVTLLQNYSWLGTALSQIRHSLKDKEWDYRPDVLWERNQGTTTSIWQILEEFTKEMHEEHLYLPQATSSIVITHNSGYHPLLVLKLAHGAKLMLAS